jgi:uncharacterized protein
MSGSVPVAPDLFTWPSNEPQLMGSRCGECGTTVFPRQGSCPRCTATAMLDALLPRTGTLWTWTVQGFRPKTPYAGPEAFEPYGVGYVDLEGQVIVEARLTTADPDELEIGAPVELVVVPFRTDPDGTEVVTFAFRPTGAREPAGAPAQGGR